MIRYIGKIPCESVIDIKGKVTEADIKSEAISQNKVELYVTEVHAITRSRATLPF
jgi:aspartyl-tRNA synthetase